MAPSISEQLKKLVSRRQRFFQSLQQCYDLIKVPDKEKSFLARCQLIDKIFEQFNEVSDEIALLNAENTDETDIEVLQVCSAFEELYYAIKEYQDTIVPPGAESTNDGPTPSTSTLKVKLPVISVPTFSGDISEFPAWKSLFDELIHNSPSLTDIQKFSYLRTYVKSPAYACIESISFCAENYKLAYKALTTRYENKRILAGHHINKILSFQTLSNDNLAGLRNFVDNFYSSVESLQGLGVPDLGDFILLSLGLRILDKRTSLEFEKAFVAHEFPTFGDLISLVKNKCSILEINFQCSKNSNSQPTSSKTVTSKSFVATTEKNNNSSNKAKCPLCSGEHKLQVCAIFLKLEPPQRLIKIKEFKRCLSCFSSSHLRNDCQSTFRCKQCGSNQHNTLLHDISRHSSQQGKSEATSQQPHPQISGVMEASPPFGQVKHVLLGTATLQVQDNFGTWHLVKGVIDPGSQISIISQRLAKILKLPRKYSSIQVSGIGTSTAQTAKGEIQCNLLPQPSLVRNLKNDLMVCDMVILETIANGSPIRLSSEIMEKFAHLKLADMTYHDPHMFKDNYLDILLGAEYYSDLISHSTSIIRGTPSAIPSKLGWLLMGKVMDGKSSHNVTTLFVSSPDLGEPLQKFWELEDIPTNNSQVMSPEDIACEEHFLKTTTRDERGRYIVRFPFKDPSLTSIGSNRDIAGNRLNSLLRKHQKNPKLHKLYDENLQSYIDEGHMTIATKRSNYLLVHHGVYKETSSTTKLRVVFDPNIKSSDGKSLSDLLMIGPKLQNDIGDLLIKFRMHAIALTCDIKAMYRSIWMHKDDCYLQHILYKFENQPTKEYALRTVTFGIPPSAYQAQRCIKQLIADEGHNFPNAAKALSDHIYVDDICTGSNDISSAISLRNEICTLLSRAGFEVRKFASSHPQVLADLSNELCEKPHTLGVTESIKILGIQWSSKSDAFFYYVNTSNSKTITKREVLSKIASVYDLNGYISPITIWMKIFLQRLWLDKGITWDTPLNETMAVEWHKFMGEINLLSNIFIPRCILPPNCDSMQIIGFCDGSSFAYAAAVYLRCIDSSGNVKIQLIRAKTKVAPLKVQTTNRLELCGALLLARVINSLSFLLDLLNIKDIYLFSDSTTVLSWLKTQPHLLKTFVANRVVQILEFTKPSQWFYVSTHENSADAPSRGMYPSEFVKHDLWFSGPSFLLKNPTEWNLSSTSPSLEKIPELKIHPTHSLAVEVKTASGYFITLIEKISDLNKLQATFAWLLRFLHNAGNPPESRFKGPLSVSEWKSAQDCLIKIVQKFYFDEATLKKYKSLAPFLNTEGILQVGGRLSNAPLPESAKHPVLLPKKCHLSLLIIRHFHVLTLHGGPKLVQSLIQRKFWIPGLRHLIRGIIRKCVHCIKMNPKPVAPYMGQLPPTRYALGRAFINVSTDLAGPFLLKTGPRRNSPIDKSYFVVFVCMATKCVHLELVTSLSTPAFLAALDRFISRRGLPSLIYSDNGTNLRGSFNYLCEVQRFWSRSSDEISNNLRQREIRWQFCPPISPNFNALAERSIRSIKSHLASVLHDRAFTYEEFYTLLVKVEAILNSRPLIDLGTTPDEDIDVLTPGHFITGGPLLARPEMDLTQENIPILKRWQLIQQASQHFWKRWLNDYLNTLIQRNKWTKTSENIAVGNVVLVQGLNPLQQRWPLGRVIKLLPGKDNIVRVVIIKTFKGELTRPVSKLVILPVEGTN